MQIYCRECYKCDIEKYIFPVINSCLLIPLLIPHCHNWCLASRWATSAKRPELHHLDLSLKNQKTSFHQVECLLVIINDTMRVVCIEQMLLSPAGKYCRQHASDRDGKIKCGKLFNPSIFSGHL